MAGSDFPNLIPRTAPLPIGTKTRRGVVAGIRSEGGPLGERFYLLKCPGGVTALMPADLVEPKAAL